MPFADFAAAPRTALPGARRNLVACSARTWACSFTNSLTLLAIGLSFLDFTQPCFAFWTLSSVTGTIVISTRRFWARPSSVSFVATG